MSKRITTSAEKKEHKQESVSKALLDEMYTILVTIYLLIILMVMPLYIYDHYYEMAFIKWKIYLFATLGFLGIVLGIGAIYSVVAICKNRAQHKEYNLNLRLDFRKIMRCLTASDVLAFLYGISVIITLFTCGYPRAAWLGTDSWYMGALAQLLFVGTFLVFSWLKAPLKDVVWMNLIASSICFVIGIAQRYGWDFLHLYYGMPAEVIRDYLSTIGNRTWYSGYISVMFPIGVYLFWHGGNKRVTCLAGVYTLAAFAAIVTNNSDSIYVAAMAVMFGLFVMSLGNLKKIYRWMYIWVIWFIACSAMAVLRILFPDYIRDLRGLSQIFLDIRFAVGGLAVASGMVFLLWYLMEKRGWKGEYSPKTCKRLRMGLVAVAFAAIGIVVGIIAVNTTGLLQEWFGFTINSNYLLFDDLWGDSRGFNWKMTLRMFGELSPLQKLFGVGSDCYAFYVYSNPVYAEVINGFFGQGVMVANAHNEWLNSLLCNGIVGSLLYFGLFISVMMKCLKQGDSKHTHPFVPAVGLCVLGYITHNTFCYQQICATGPMFLLMGLAVQNVRKGGHEQNE